MELPSENWFYAKGGQRTGPISLEQIRNLLRHGHIDRDNDLVWAEGLGLTDWQPAVKIPGLVEERPLAPMHPPPPAAPVQAPVIPVVKRTRYGLMLGLGLGSIGPIFIGGALLGGALLGMALSPSRTPGLTLAAVGGGILLFLGIAMALFASVQFFAYLYRAWVIVQPFKARTTPGVAVGLCFVPIFNCYWWLIAFWGWARDYQDSMQRQPALFQMAPPVTPGLFLANCILLAICFPTVLLAETHEAVAGTAGLLLMSALILQTFCAYQMCSVVNYFAAVHTAPPPTV